MSAIAVSLFKRFPGHERIERKLTVARMMLEKGQAHTAIEYYQAILKWLPEDVEAKAGLAEAQATLSAAGNA